MFEIFLSYCKNEDYILEVSATDKLKTFLEKQSDISENKECEWSVCKEYIDMIIMNQAKAFK